MLLSGQPPTGGCNTRAWTRSRLTQGGCTNSNAPRQQRRPVEQRKLFFFFLVFLPPLMHRRSVTISVRGGGQAVMDMLKNCAAVSLIPKSQFGAGARLMRLHLRSLLSVNCPAAMKQRNNGVDPSKRHPGFDNCARVSGRQARHHRSELSSGHYSS